MIYVLVLVGRGLIGAGLYWGLLGWIIAVSLTLILIGPLSVAAVFVWTAIIQGTWALLVRGHKFGFGEDELTQYWLSRISVSEQPQGAENCTTVKYRVRGWRLHHPAIYEIPGPASAIAEWLMRPVAPCGCQTHFNRCPSRAGGSPPR